VAVIVALITVFFLEIDFPGDEGGNLITPAWQFQGSYNGWSDYSSDQVARKRLSR
jgi:hypothetical protein